MHRVLADYVERGVVPGLVTLVSRRGETHVDALGTLVLGRGKPMRRDTIFRISSMTKPIIAVATLLLVEECTLRLDDPVDRLLRARHGPGPSGLPTSIPTIAPPWPRWCRN
jgi:CubicO group peptidase (beta-lactamase class C family)